MHPIGTTSDMKNFGAEDTMALMGELRDLKCEYQHHIVYLRSEVPDFGSDVMRHGYPCEREYSDVLADLRDHIARLEEAAQHVWESEQTLVATSHG